MTTPIPDPAETFRVFQMNEHAHMLRKSCDLPDVGDAVAICSCGNIQVATTLDEAEALWATHAAIERARRHSSFHRMNVPHEHEQVNAAASAVNVGERYGRMIVYVTELPDARAVMCPAVQEWGGTDYQCIREPEHLGRHQSIEEISWDELSIGGPPIPFVLGGARPIDPRNA